MQQFWIFGYGSLMWRPGFQYIACEPAVLRGYRRRLCVYSFVHRGTPEQPGLVLGLDRGGSCTGMAFRIDPDAWHDTIAYLRAREQVTMVYREEQKNIRLTDSRRTEVATTYVVDRKHQQYAGHLPISELLTHVKKGEGQSGHCIEYVTNTVDHLRQMKIHDATLETLMKQLKLQAGSAKDWATSEKPE